MRIMDDEVHVLRLDKNGEHYVFVYTAEHRRDMLRQLTRWAKNPDLSFGWYDAARLSHEIRNW